MNIPSSAIPPHIQNQKELDIMDRTSNRYQRILKTLLSAKQTPPGDRMVTASAQSFIEKRAALQEKDASALPKLRGALSKLKGFFKKAPKTRVEKTVREIKDQFSTTPNRTETITKTLDGDEKTTSLYDRLVSPTGLVVGGSLLGVGALTAPYLERIGYEARAAGYPNMYERMRMDEEAAKSFAINVGKEVGKKTVGLAGDLVSKGLDIPTNFLQGRTQKSVFDQLRSEDEVLSQADPGELQNAYHTMARFAPTLATDANAVKTFLRESTLYGTGPNFMAIKQLADAERAVNPAQMMIKAKPD